MGFICLVVGLGRGCRPILTWSSGLRGRGRRRRRERQRRAIPELVEVRPEKMMQEAGAGENPSTGKQMSPVARQSEEELE